MQLKNIKHNKPMYYMEYISSIELGWIQVDLGSALIIMPRMLIQFIGIFPHMLTPIITTTFGFNANGSHSLVKIRPRYKMRDLKTEVTYYINDADTLYNLRFGWLWIHTNMVIQSTLHNCKTYVDKDEKVCTLIAEK